MLLWSGLPGRVAKLQCDFSAMISPDMFKEFVLPYLKKQCDYLDYSLCHLDGHLCWDGIYKKILEAGKLIYATMKPHEVKPFVKRFGKRNVLIYTNTTTEDEALRLIAETK